MWQGREGIRRFRELKRFEPGVLGKIIQALIVFSQNHQAPFAGTKRVSSTCCPASPYSSIAANFYSLSDRNPISSSVKCRPIRSFAASSVATNDCSLSTSSCYAAIPPKSSDRNSDLIPSASFRKSLASSGASNRK
jgi:hypothetical protein